MLGQIQQLVIYVQGRSHCVHKIRGYKSQYNREIIDVNIIKGLTPFYSASPLAQGTPGMLRAAYAYQGLTASAFSLPWRSAVDQIAAADPALSGNRNSFCSQQRLFRLGYPPDVPGECRTIVKSLHITQWIPISCC